MKTVPEMHAELSRLAITARMQLEAQGKPPTPQLRALFVWLDDNQPQEKKQNAE